MPGRGSSVLVSASSPLIPLSGKNSTCRAVQICRQRTSASASSQSLNDAGWVERRRVANEELPLASSEPLMRAERVAYARSTGERRAYEVDACKAHLYDLWNAYPVGMP